MWMEIDLFRMSSISKYLFRPCSSLSDHRFRRAEDRLQEPHRPMQQPQPARAAGICSPHLLQRAVPHRRRVLLTLPQRSPHCLPRPQVG